MKRLSIILCLLITQICYSAEFKGLLSLNNVSAGKHKISKLEVKYRIYTLMGEACKGFVLKYSFADNAKLNNIKLRARVLCGTKQNAYLSFSPMIPKPDKWGFDVSASPNWEDLFFTKNGGAISAEQAKQYFKDSFSLVDLEVIEISAEESNPFDEKYDGRFFKVNRNTVTDLEKELPVDVLDDDKENNKWAQKRMFFSCGFRSS